MSLVDPDVAGPGGSLLTYAIAVDDLSRRRGRRSPVDLPARPRLMAASTGESAAAGLSSTTGSLLMSGARDIRRGRFPRTGWAP